LGWDLPLARLTAKGIGKLEIAVSLIGIAEAAKCKGAYAKSTPRIASRSGYQGDEMALTV